jgi:hypothetical protein
MPFAFLLSLQSAGMVFDWLGRRNQVEIGRMGERITQAGIESNIQMTRLESEDASLQAMKQLRMNLGSQAAIMAARGTRSGAGTALALSNQSVGNFNADERTRKVNQKAREASIRAGGVISSLHQKTNEAQIWSEFRNNIINKIPTSPSAWGQMGKALSGGFGVKNIASGNLY